MFKITFTSLLLFSSLIGETLSFGVVPQQSPSVLVKKWLPIIHELSEKSGFDITFKTEKSIPEFEKKLYNGEYDIAYMNPYHFVIADKRVGFKALTRSKKMIQGIVVSNETVNDYSKESFKRKTFLFPAPKAFAATLLTKYEFKKVFGVDIEKDSHVSYVNSHDSVYKGVAREIGNFGGGIIRTYKNLSDKETKENIEIIYITDSYPSHPIGIKKGLGKEKIDLIEKALFSISKKSLQKLHIPELTPTTNSEYDIVKDLAIKLEIYE
jgi:phosphonate transport system substrate-binding protein